VLELSRTRNKECHNYYWHTNDYVPIEMCLTIKLNQLK